MSEVIITSTGKVEKIDGKWMIIPDKNSPDIRFLGFTDRIPYDCAVIRHKSKYGLFYVSDMTSIIWGNENPPLICFDSDNPFPYDEIVIKGVAINEIMLIGYKIGNNWGIDNIYYNLKNRTLGRKSLTSCRYPSVLEAENDCLMWDKPFKDD